MHGRARCCDCHPSPRARLHQGNVDKIVNAFGANPAKLAKMFAQLRKLYGEVPAYTGMKS